MPADDGPAEWQRISVQVDLERREGEPGDSGRKVDIVEPVEPIEPVALPPVEVSDVQIEQQSLSFSVDQVGVPVVVKVSYFPNWEVDGRTGPVSHRAEHDGGRPDGQRGRADLRAKRRRLAVHAAHGGRHRALHLLAVPRRRPACRRGPGVRPAGGRRPGATARADDRRRRTRRRRRSRPRSLGPAIASNRTASPRRTVDPSPTGTAADRRRSSPSTSIRPAGRGRTGRPPTGPTIPPDSVDGRHVSTGSDRQGV